MHHDAVLPNRYLLEKKSQSREASKSPYHDPYANLPTKPNQVGAREINQQLRQAELAGI